MTCVPVAVAHLLVGQLSPLRDERRAGQPRPSAAARAALPGSAARAPPSTTPRVAGGRGPGLRRQPHRGPHPARRPPPPWSVPCEPRTGPQRGPVTAGGGGPGLENPGQPASV